MGSMMMLVKRHVLCVVLLFMLATTSVVLEGRPLSTTDLGGDDVEFFDWLNLRGIKSSGPSGGGEGHRVKDTLGGIKNSGPSNPGEGH
ncbi:PAMP-induced secreted peptide 2-like [Senna tora]|uniref:PAMP-induced secreted peptide 2-like n=1 Tax=Senna tora TaxID=362788 RepID=A0A834SSZ0_9FABA|nr:PAMP-induced secreted peptide 2-like [Senna tora]